MTHQHASMGVLCSAPRWQSAADRARGTDAAAAQWRAAVRRAGQQAMAQQQHSVNVTQPRCRALPHSPTERTWRYNCRDSYKWCSSCAALSPRLSDVAAQCSLLVLAPVSAVAEIFESAPRFVLNFYSTRSTTVQYSSSAYLIPHTFAGLPS